MHIDFQYLFVTTEASMNDLRQGSISTIYEVSYDNYSTEMSDCV